MKNHEKLCDFFLSRLCKMFVSSFLLNDYSKKTRLSKIGKMFNSKSYKFSIEGTSLENSILTNNSLLCKTNRYLCKQNCITINHSFFGHISQPYVTIEYVLSKRHS